MGGFEGQIRSKDVEAAKTRVGKKSSSSVESTAFLKAILAKKTMDKTVDSSTVDM